MSETPRYFVIFGAMRTGSNFLEEQLQRVQGVSCHGELFNPLFIGKVGRDTAFSVDMIQREADPHALLSAMVEETETLPGFRYFDGHDPRVFEALINDHRCAKVILTRNPVESYISLCIARNTNQWKLTNFTRRRSAQAHFDADEFDDYLATLDAYHTRITDGLARVGQTAFHIRYEQLTDVSIFNGLLSFLGVEGRIGRLNGKIKKQNPGSLDDLVENANEMRDALSNQDRFGLNRSVVFEQRRPAQAPVVFLAQKAGLAFAPVGRQNDPRLFSWMTDLTGERPTRMTVDRPIPSQLGALPGLLKISLIEHPLRRCYGQFCSRILLAEGEQWDETRRVMRQHHNVPIPARGLPPRGFTLEEQREAFAAYLRFIKANLTGLSSLNVRREWATQSALAEAMSEQFLPDIWLRGTRLVEDLALLALRLGLDAPELTQRPDETPHPLAALWTDEIETLARDAYARDYERFSFGPWEPEQDLER